MKKPPISIVILSCGLFLAYGKIILQYQGLNPWLTAVSWVFVISSVGLLFLQEWARKILFFLSFFLIVFYAYAFNFIALLNQHITPLSFIAIVMPLVLTVFFLNLSGVKKYFQKMLIQPKGTILAIDDDRGLLKLLKVNLTSKGFDVVTALTGEQGLELARKRHPNLILLDVILPGKKGRQVCKELKEDPKTKDIPVVFLTAKDSPDDVQAEKEAGAVAHITKPIDSKKLFADISRILGI
ncbi:MAG: response regulator [Candidatus Omnitrophota bacterium]